MVIFHSRDHHSAAAPDMRAGNPEHEAVLLQELAWRCSMVDERAIYPNKITFS